MKRQKRWTSYILHTVLILIFYFAFFLVTKYPEWRHRRQCERKCLGFWAKNVLDTADFSRFDNERGRRDGRYVVPNYVHFLRIGLGEITFTEAACLLAAWKHQKPAKLFLHVDRWPRGEYWERLTSYEAFNDVLLPVTGAYVPHRIDGVNLHPRVIRQRGLLLSKLQILMKYGGIFLDNNSFMVKNMNDFRRYEMTLDGNETVNRTTKVIVANKNARLLKIWIDSHLNVLNTTQFLRAKNNVNSEIYTNYPSLFHREKFFLLDNERILKKLYYQQWREWTNHYVLHLPDQRAPFGPSNHKYPIYNEVNITKNSAAFKLMITKVFPDNI